LFSIQRRPGATRGAEWVWRRRRRDQLFSADEPRSDDAAVTGRSTRRNLARRGGRVLRHRRPRRVTFRQPRGAEVASPRVRGSRVVFAHGPHRPHLTRARTASPQVDSRIVRRQKVSCAALGALVGVERWGKRRVTDAATPGRPTMTSAKTTSSLPPDTATCAGPAAATSFTTPPTPQPEIAGL
jgi:hypothetical protein